MYKTNTRKRATMNGRPGRWSSWGMWLLLSVCPLTALAADESTPPAAPAGEAIPQNPVLQDDFRFTVGGYYATTTSIARLDAQTATGIDIDFEDVLGLDDRRLVGEGAMYWRFTKRWRLDVNYFGIARRGTRVLSQDIVWGDHTFTVGTTVDGSFRLSDMRVALGYSFFRRPDKEVGLGLGLHATGVRARLEAEGIGGEAGDVTAPLPVLSFYGNFALTDTWAMTAHWDWLSLEYSDYSGTIRASALDFVYQPFRHVGFGFGWHSLIMALGIDKTDWRGKVLLSYQGPAAYVSFSF